MAQYENFPAGQVIDYARNGSSVTVRDASGAVLSTPTVGQMDALQRWSNSGAIVSISNYTYVFWVVFPAPITLTGAIWGAYDGSEYTDGYIDYSSDSTNGIDGTWTNWTSRRNIHIVDDTVYRKSCFTVGNVPGVSSVRLRTNNSSWDVRSFVLWTTTPVGGLAAWHPTNDEALSNDTLNLDRGDIFMNAAPVTQTFRVKNTDGTQTANDVVVQVDATGSGQLQNEVQFSLDDVSYGSSVTIPSIAPGAISPLIYMYRPLITDAAGVTRAAFVSAGATSWT